jgi:S1-C subfamily serine protease
VTKPGQPTLGLTARTMVTSPGHRDGVAIVSVAADGPAESAGLRPGDVITLVDGCPIQSEAQLAALLAALTPGMQLYLTYTRSGRAHTATVTLAASWS